MDVGFNIPTYKIYKYAHLMKLVFKNVTNFNITQIRVLTVTP
jgi:hypothetical protein